MAGHLMPYTLTSEPMWVTTIRRETGLIEHVCQHGVGHPAWASAHWLASTGDSGDVDDWLTHGCDGCCDSQEWQQRSLRDSVERAHEIILDQHAVIERLKAALIDGGPTE